MPCASGGPPRRIDRRKATGAPARSCGHFKRREKTVSVGEGGFVTVFEQSAAARPSDVYSVAAGGKPVFVERWEDIHYAHFAFSGECEVTVSVKPSIGHRNLKYIHAYSISPRRAGVCAESELNTLTFTLAEPRKLVIQVNEYQRLFLFADAAKEHVPSPGDENVIDAGDFVTEDAAAALQTENIRAAVEAVPPGGTLYFGPGLYRTGTVTLKSDMTLYLAGGAILKGSSDPKDFPQDEDSGHWANRAFVNVPGCSNVRIAGFGTLDANGTEIRNLQHGPHLLVIRDSENVVVEDIFVRDPAAWNTHPINSDNVTLRNIKMLNNRDVLNTDGFDVSSSRNVTVENCFAYTSDDAVVIKSYGDSETRDVTVRGNVLLPKKSALKVGTETEADIANVTFIDNDVVECDRGMSLYVEDGARVSNVAYINNRFESFYPDARRRLLDFYIWNRKGGGNIENVLIKDCVADTRWPLPSTMIGLDEENAIRGVRFENFTLAGKVCTSLEDADVIVDVYPFEDVRRPHVFDITFEPEGAPWNPALLEKSE